jgi:hypothetical protein
LPAVAAGVIFTRRNRVLEYFKVFISFIDAVVPLIALFIAGCWFNDRIEKIKSRLQIDHSIIEKRADIYADIQEDINAIYSYIRRIGNWKDLTPPKILIAKRKIDRTMYSTKPYWSKSVMDDYKSFMNVCFKTNLGHTKDAGIIANVNNYKKLSNWEPEFIKAFETGFDEVTLDRANESLQNSLSKDFGIVNEI